IDVVGLQFGWQTLVVGSEHLDIRRVVVGDNDGVVVNTDVSIQSSEEVLSQMGRIPTFKGIANSLPELMNHRLGEQSHGHLAIADVEVESAGALPTQILIELEKLFDVPALGKVLRHGFDLGSVRATKKALELIFLRALTGALHELIAAQLI